MVPRQAFSSDCIDRYAVSPNHDARPDGCEVDLVVVHAISLPPGEYGGHYVDDLFMNRLDADAHPYFAGVAEMRVSAHFFIARDGSVTQYVAPELRAWHAGASCWEARDACNDFSVGIELEGTDDAPFADVQYTRLTALARDLIGHFGALDAARFVGHSDIAPGRKTDPGPGFDWARLRAAVCA